jgi:hypothetical protein
MKIPREQIQIRTPDLGGRRGVLSDWVTQQWVRATGRRIAFLRLHYRMRRKVLAVD